MEKNKLFNKLAWSCQKATELMDKKSVVKLSFKENFQLVVHKSMCDACREYEKQSQLLHSLVKNHLKNNDVDTIKIIPNNDLKINVINSLKENN